MPISEGKKAPFFDLPDASGSIVSLRDQLGSWVVLYFYPKDDTPGCTREACSFRDNMARIETLGAVIIGISPDSAASHRKFADKHGLPFTLLADDHNQVAAAYGVWVEKSMYGKKYLGVERTTFLIDPRGMIRKVFPKVKVDGHVDEVIAALSALQEEA